VFAVAKKFVDADAHGFLNRGTKPLLVTMRRGVLVKMPGWVIRPHKESQPRPTTPPAHDPRFCQ